MAIIVFLVFVVFLSSACHSIWDQSQNLQRLTMRPAARFTGSERRAFAGDYLSAASFLGICGLNCHGWLRWFLIFHCYLAGWVVALFVVAEPLKRLGKYTFTDAVDANYNSRGIKLAAAISTLVVSVCYLIPQMVGAGVLVDRCWASPMPGASSWSAPS